MRPDETDWVKQSGRLPRRSEMAVLNHPLSRDEKGRLRLVSSALYAMTSFFKIISVLIGTW